MSIRYSGPGYQITDADMQRVFDVLPAGAWEHNFLSGPDYLAIMRKLDEYGPDADPATIDEFLDSVTGWALDYQQEGACDAAEALRSTDWDWGRE